MAVKKICPRCGIIFEVKTSEEKFCSTRCEKLFKESSLGYVKKGPSMKKDY
ncbi:MAG: hypothetical protein ACOX1V_01120 [Candidatus Iainarchaeum sp.]|jgi:uncharacterized C2H2 Zn-finger protein